MKKILWIILIIMIAYSSVITILYVNMNKEFKKTKNDLKSLTNVQAPPITSTFYAQIQKVDMDKNTILVKGLDFDTVYNKEYLLELSDETLLIGNGNTGGSNVLTLSCFYSNQYISVTYSGAIQYSEEYDIIGRIHKVQLLEERNK